MSKMSLWMFWKVLGTASIREGVSSTFRWCFLRTGALAQVSHIGLCKLSCRRVSH